MSEIKVTKCDVCDERTDDSCDYRGWIRTTGRFSISKGRDKNKNAQSGYMGDAERDFCSRKCFLSWLDKL